MCSGAESPCKPAVFSRQDFSESHGGFCENHPLNPRGIVSTLTEYERVYQGPKNVLLIHMQIPVCPFSKSSVKAHLSFAACISLILLQFPDQILLQVEGSGHLNSF